MRITQISKIVAAVGLSLSTGAGCGSEAGEPPIMHRDSADITIVESTAPEWNVGEGWVVDDLPVLDLAEAGEGPVHEFFNSTDASRLSDGSLVVADDGSDEIRIFSPAGIHLRTIGRSGEGPGEFVRLTQVFVLPEDSILAYDYWQARITVFDRQGQGTRITRLEGAYRPRPLFPLESGGFIGRSTDFSAFGDELGPHRMLSPIVRLSDEGTVIDTLVTVNGYESVVFSQGDAWSLWGKDAHLAVYGDDVYLGTADSLEYQVFSPEGRLKRIVRVPGYDLTLSREEIRAERSAYMPDPAEANATTREVMDLQPDRTHRPAYSDMIVDDYGNVWLRRYQGRHEQQEPTEWLIFAPNGEWLGSMALPPRFHVFQIGPDWIIGKRPDELDVEHIQLLRLSRDADSVAIGGVEIAS
jgi:hypothetical protein